MIASRVEQCVEAVCEQGCRKVLKLLDQLAEGERPDLVAGLSEEEVAEVAQELSDIMAVYEQPCDMPPEAVTAANQATADFSLPLATQSILRSA